MSKNIYIGTVDKIIPETEPITVLGVPLYVLGGPLHVGPVEGALPSGKVIQIRDFVLDGLNLRLTQTETEYWSQKIENTLKVNLGEYFLDRSLGVPYWGPDGQIIKKTADLNEIQDLLIIAIVSIEGINNVEKFTPNFNQTTRTYTVDIRVMTDSGVTVEGVINI